MHERARHAGEFEHALHVAREELTDDVAHISTAAEALGALAAKDNRAHFRMALDATEEVAQRGVGGEGERVDAVGAIERDGGHAIRCECVTKAFFSDVHVDAPSVDSIIAVASISTSARSSSSALTCTSDIAGKCLPMRVR